MSNRTFLVLTMSLGFATAAWATDEPSFDGLQVAQATAPLGVVSARADVRSLPHMHGTKRGVLEAADKGPDALRRYVDRTRMIYGYRFEDYAKAEWYR
jgi:hypothetical protein